MIQQLLLVPFLAGCSQSVVDEDLTQYVDPFIGTDFTGHVYPGATTPFGMVQLSPDVGNSGWMYCSGYHSDSPVVQGFSHTHLSGTGAPDMGDILLMPVVGTVPFESGDAEHEGYRSAFSHDTEQASAGYYRVRLSDYDVLAELTATPRVGVHRYTFPNAPEAGLLIDLQHGISDETVRSAIRVVDEQTVVGERHSRGFVSDHQYYFCLRLSEPIARVESLCDGVQGEETDVSGCITKMILRFPAEHGRPLVVKVGLSTASEEGARRNLETEMPGWDFDEVLSQTRALWNDYLGRIEIEPRDEGQRISFYTSLYHALIMPNLISDVDGSYSGWDHQVHRDPARAHYTNFSLWDTYRAEHPFLELLYPEVNSLLMNSLLEKHRQTGLLATNEYGQCETWCMIGNHAVDVLVDAWLKGDSLLPAEETYEAVRHAMTCPHPKSDWDSYDRCGYFPYDSGELESVSRTMEACYDDYCVALMAQALGRDEDYSFFLNRAGNYRHLFDARLQMVRPRSAQGEWKEPFNPNQLNAGNGDFTEGNAWQWTWHVQHDAEGLISQFGSAEAFMHKLDSLFFIDPGELPGHEIAVDVTGLIGQYAHGNEPSHHVAYLYTLAGAPWKTARIVREIFDKYYLPKRDGLCGNDDCGQMSAWYIFSALGFYPVSPVSGEYVFGAPQLNGATLHLPGGKTFCVKANGLSDANKYVNAIRLNGQPIDYTAIKYGDIMQGGTLEYDLTSQAE
ncbi:MAG: GH92 family glycosyl hydrolase [Bacteroidaceae bacterium]|nr:GH92 family glycosyl hydrolase [Bacteroidaceae bacterium]